MKSEISTTTNRLAQYPELAAMYEKRHKATEYRRYWSRNTLPKDLADKGIPFPGIRNALGFKRGLEISKLAIEPEELIIGAHPFTDHDLFGSGEWNGCVAPYIGGITGHMGIDLERLLSLGLNGVRNLLLERLKKYHNNYSPMHTDNLEQRASKIEAETFEQEDFLRAGLITLEAAIDFQKRYADEAKRIGSKYTDIFANVPAKPATTFHEALQSIYFTLMLCTYSAGLMGIGRLDQVLFPIYQNDLKAGRLTKQRAIELLGAFYIKSSELMDVPMTIMLGGQTRDGKPATNELSYLMLEAADIVRLHNPSIGIAVNEDTPDDLLLKGAQMVTSGYSHPAFFNDRSIVKGLTDLGVKPEHARWHLHCTCTEITPCYYSGVWVVATYINFGRIMEWIVNGGISSTSKQRLDHGHCEWESGQWSEYFNSDIPSDRTPAPEDITSFEQVKHLVKQYLAYVVRETVRLQNNHASNRKVQGAFPFLSLFINDCIEKEADIERGGAKYTFFYPQLVGVPTAVDSLMAIQKIVFEDKQMSFTDYAKQVRDNFAGAEALRQTIRNKMPKYGTNDPQADDLAREIIEFYYGEISKYKNPYGDPYAPGFLSWIMHAELGKCTVATPDGRLAGQALSDSLASVQGMAKKGPTAMLGSVETLDLTPAVGAVVVNVTIPVSQPDENMVQAVKSMIKSHFSRGGFELQFNVMSKERLQAAQKDPNSHRDLLVRVGGYSDYFVNLNAEIQEELIRRFD